MLNKPPGSEVPEVTVQSPDILGLYNHITATREAERAAEKAREAAEAKAKASREAAEKAAREAKSKAEAANKPKTAKPSEVMQARDTQTFGQQSEWTQQAFKAQYGDQAENQWRAQHESERQQNKAVYGTYEPNAGQKSLDGRTTASDRTIGRTAPPVSTAVSTSVPKSTDSYKGVFDPRIKPNATYTPPSLAKPGQPTLVNGSPSAMGTTPTPGTPSTVATPDPDANVDVYRDKETGKLQRIHKTQLEYEPPNKWEYVGPASVYAPTKPTEPTGTAPVDTKTLPGTTGTAPTTQPLSLTDTNDPPTYALAKLTSKPGENLQQASSNIVQGIGKLIRGEAGGEAYEPYLNDMARMAWAKQEREQGRQADPRNAPGQYIESWKDAFFGSDHSVPGVKDLDQQLIDNAVERSAPGGPFNWKAAFGQNGELGLISRQVTSNDCGPNSFANILRSRGYNIDPEQALDLAKKYGYHNGEEFTGPINFARMLREEAGINAQAQRLDWNKINEELDAGRPVVVSSGTHYWTIAGKKDTPDGPVYYTGATGAVVRNPEWARADQIQFAYNGDPGIPDVMITASGTANPNARGIQELGLRPPGPTRENLSAMTRQMQNGSQQYSGQPWAPSRSTNNDPYSTMKMSGSEGNPPSFYVNFYKNTGDDRLVLAAAGAQDENPWNPDLNAQRNRHQGMKMFYDMPSTTREGIFSDSMTEALKAEGIPQEEWGYWKDNMNKIVKGTPDFPGENPSLNPFMMAGESRGTPMYASDPSDRSPNSNELNSSAQGYYQFIIHSPDGSDAYGHKAFIPEGANFYDPVTQHRMFIRAIRSPGSKHHGDPASVVREKQQTKVWGP